MAVKVFLIRELNTKLSYDSHLINNDDKFCDRHAKTHFKWPLIRHKSEDISTSGSFIQPGYKFSYETDCDVKQIEFTKPSDLIALNGLDGQTQTFNFSTAFNFSQTKSVDQDASNNYKTIFTYSDPVTNVIDCQLDIFDFMDTGYSKNVNSRLHYSFLVLSALLLIIFFPFLCWFYVKRLAKSERIIVFRLGKRMKSKGPGWVFLLPICDRYHLITLDDQLVKIKPVSGGTKDEAVVEVTCSIVFYLLESDYAFSITNKSPLDIVTTQTQLCLLSALTHLEWYYLEQGNAKIDLANETKGTLNSRCGPYGIHVKEVTIDGLVLLRPPPSHNSKSNIELVTKHLHQLSCVLLNSRGDKPLIKPPTSQSNVEQQIINLSNGSEQTNSTSMSCDTTDIISDSEITTTTITNESSSVETTPLINKVQKQYSFKSLNTLSQLRISHNYPALSKAITRAQGLLNSNIACQALDCASLQLVISMENKFVKDHLPLLNSVENRNFILLYLDAGTGTVGSGCLPVDKQPANVTLFIHIDDLTDVVEGRLDVINAIKSDKSFHDRFIISVIKNASFTLSASSLRI